MNVFMCRLITAIYAIISHILREPFLHSNRKPCCQQSKKQAEEEKEKASKPAMTKGKSESERYQERKTVSNQSLPTAKQKPTKMFHPTSISILFLNPSKNNKIHKKSGYLDPALLDLVIFGVPSQIKVHRVLESRKLTRSSNGKNISLLENCSHEVSPESLLPPHCLLG